MLIASLFDYWCKKAEFPNPKATLQAVFPDYSSKSRGIDEPQEFSSTSSADLFLRPEAPYGSAMGIYKEFQGLTLQQLANEPGITQNRISKLEPLDLDRAELQSIRSYVNALGGQLSLVVDIDGNQNKIQIRDEC
jgi:hypothetical protein